METVKLNHARLRAKHIDSQAEPCPTEKIHDQPQLYGDQADQSLTAIQAEPGAGATSRVQAEQDKSSSNTQNTRESHTSLWAVARYVSIPIITSIVPKLTKQHQEQPPVSAKLNRSAVETAELRQRTKRAKLNRRAVQTAELNQAQLS